MSLPQYQKRARVEAESKLLDANVKYNLSEQLLQTAKIHLDSTSQDGSSAGVVALWRATVEACTESVDRNADALGEQIIRYSCAYPEDVDPLPELPE